jgi:acyl-[acyl-carrier-protein]-phospholipid O-acyltransferase/long-chain-fatty-acid--[acyl-carrier-protein] ligase
MNYFSLLKRPDFSQLFLCQFFSAFADNIFKTGLLILATFNVAFRTDFSPGIMSALISAVFILPFVMFAGLSGELTNHIENTKLSRILKKAEAFIIFGAWIGLYFESMSILFVCLFLSSTQASFFGPIKYSLIPAYLDPKDRIAGNGLIESSTFLAILLGTTIGGILPKSLLGIFMVASSLMSLYSANRMVPSQVPIPSTTIEWHPLINTRKLIRFALKDRVLFLSIIGISWFWLLGIIILTGIVPYTEETLRGDQNLASFFMASFTIGISFGSYLCHKLLRGNLHVGYIPISALLMSVFIFDFVWASDHFISQGIVTLTAFLKAEYSWRIIIDLFMLATFGGIYTVPLYGMIQERSAPHRRGTAISANNFFNSLFMIIASIAVMLLTALDLKLLHVFGITALINLFVTIKIANHVPESLRQMILQFIFSTCFRVDIRGIENIKKAGRRSIIIANHTSFLDGLLIFAYLPFNTAFIIYHQYAYRWFAWISKGIKVFFIDPQQPLIMKYILQHLNSDHRVVIFPEGRMTSTGSLMKINEGPAMLAERTNATILPIRIDGAEHSRLTRLKGKIKRRMFPKITIHIQDPIRVENCAGNTPVETRKNISERIERLMEEMTFETRAYKETLFDSLVDASKRHGRFTKIIEDHDRKPLTYFSFLMKSCVLGTYFHRMTDMQERVGVLLPTSCAASLAIFGLMSHGRVPVMLNYSLGDKSLLETILSTDLRTIITSRKFISNLAHLQIVEKEAKAKNIKIICLEDLASKKSSYALTLEDKLRGIKFALTPASSYKVFRPHPDDLAIMLFTSGSEQLPKAAGLSHKNINSNVAQITACLDFTAKDLLLNILPVYHSFGLTAGVFLPLLSGIPTFSYPSPLHYKVIPTLAYDLNATVFFGTSSLLLKYGEAAHNYDFYSMRYVVAGAEKLTTTTRNLWQDKFGIRILEGYGMTEASPAVSFNTPMHNQNGTVGKLLPGMKASIKPIEGIDEGGELCLKGPNIMMGYWNGKEFVPPSGEYGYETGDIVTIDEKGFIKIIGRLKRFAKISGEMIPLAYIEELIHKHYPDSGICLVAIPHEQRGEELVLVTTNKEITHDAMNTLFVKEKYPPLFCPKKVMYEEEIPLMGSGKVDVNRVKSIVMEKIAA